MKLKEIVEIGLEDSGSPIVVEIGPEDDESPILWSTKKRLLHTIAYGCTTLCAQFNATALAPSIPTIAAEGHVGREIATLAMSIYILGNGFGPMLFAPLSETNGRKVGVLIPFMVSSFLTIVVANVNSLPAFTVFRFLAGVCAAAPIVSSGAAMADLWRPEHRAAALVLYSIFILMGATFGPIFGALLETTGSHGWRYTCWLGGGLGLVVSLTNFCTLSETYRPVMAAQKARKIRLTTGHWEVHAKHEEWALTFKEFVLVHCARPVCMFLTPIVLAMATFASFVYGLIFLVITSVGENFEKVKGFEGASRFLPLIGVFIGFLLGGAANVYNSVIYGRFLKKGRAVPEHRLIMMMFVCWTVPTGCFIFGWTLSPGIHWGAPCVGLGFLGFGMVVVFQGCLNYIVDCYPLYSASGIAANTLLRSLFAGIFPLFAPQLFGSIGVSWGSSVMGFISLALLPIPFVFYQFGARARQISPFKCLVT